MEYLTTWERRIQLPACCNTIWCISTTWSSLCIQTRPSPLTYSLTRGSWNSLQGTPRPWSWSLTIAGAVLELGLISSYSRPLLHIQPLLHQDQVQRLHQPLLLPHHQLLTMEAWARQKNCLIRILYEFSDPPGGDSINTGSKYFPAGKTPAGDDHKSLDSLGGSKADSDGAHKDSSKTEAAAGVDNKRKASDDGDDGSIMPLFLKHENQII